MERDHQKTLGHCDGRLNGYLTTSVAHFNAVADRVMSLA